MIRALFAFTVAATTAWLTEGVAFTPGNVAISRVGAVNGPAPSVTTVAVFIDEYTPAGTLVQSVALPTTLGPPPLGSGQQPWSAVLPGQNPLICLAASANGMAGTAGLLTRSTNGQWLQLMAMNQSLGTVYSASTTPGWSIARVAVNGTVDTSTSLAAHHIVRRARGCRPAGGWGGG